MTVSTQPSLAERTLDLAQEVLAGRGSTEELGRLLNELVAAAAAAHQEFVANSKDNPEMSEQAAAEIGGAMEKYHTALVAMQKACAENKPAALAEPLAQAQESRAFVRHAQNVFRRYLEQGDTIHTYLNRVLLHIDHFARGNTETRHTTALLEGLPMCATEIRRNVRTIDDPHVLADAEANLDDLFGRLDELFDAVANDFSGVDDRAAFLGRLKTEIIAASNKLALALASQMQQDLALGRTPLAAVNIALALTDRIVSGNCTPEQYVDGLNVAARMLEGQVPGHADEQLVESVNEVKAILNRMLSLATHPDPEKAQAESAALTAAGENLAMLAAVLAADDENLLDVVSGEGLVGGGPGRRGRGLPRMLSGLLQLGEMFLDGQATREQIEEGIRGLEQLIQSTEAQASSGGKHAEEVQESMTHLRTAADAMWSMADNQDREQLDAAEEAMTLANESLKKVVGR